MDKFNEITIRERVVDAMLGWCGGKRGGAEHKEILAIYNARRPLPRGYTLSEKDAYCAAAVSAAWLKAGCDVLGLVPIECSCGMMLRLAKGAGTWHEEDAYIPKAGDVVLYDWQDSGAGDNLGAPDHAGVVVEVAEDSGYFTVAEGNTNGGTIDTRTMHLNGQFIRGFITPDYAAIARELAANKTSSETTQETVSIHKHRNFSHIIISVIPVSAIKRLDLLTSIPKQTLAEYYKQNKKPAILVNAGFFDSSTGLPCFGLVDDTKTISPDWNLDGFGIRNYNSTNFEYGKMNDRPWTDWIAGYPVLVADGKPCTPSIGLELSGKNIRMALGYNDKNIFLIEARKPGVTFKELTNLFIELGAKYALNLDGGGSSRMLIKGTAAGNYFENRKVPSALAVYLKKDAEKKLSPYVRPGANTTVQYQIHYNEDAEWVQDRLRYFGYELGGTDGYFWYKTRAAVEKFQKEHNIFSDAPGVVGPVTMAALSKV